MGTAVFAGRTFRLDPDSVRWSFKSKISDVATVGGKVIQVYGTTISDMTVTGSFGVGGWQQQAEFLQQMKSIGQEQAMSGRAARGIAQRQPYRFSYPPRGWEFLVYLKAYEDPGGAPKAIRLAADVINPKWKLVFHIVEDNSGLKKVAQDAYIARLSKGIGWRQTEFNGPTGETMLGQMVGTNNGPLSSGGSAQEDTTGGVYRGVGNQTTDVERWRPLVLRYFPTNVEQMLCIMRKESGGNPNAKNPTSTAMGLFQVMASVWAESFNLEPNNLYHAETNVRIAREIYNIQGYKAWPNTAKACGLL